MDDSRLAASRRAASRLAGFSGWMDDSQLADFYEFYGSSAEDERPNSHTSSARDASQLPGSSADTRVPWDVRDAESAETSDAPSDASQLGDAMLYDRPCTDCGLLGWGEWCRLCHAYYGRLTPLCWFCSHKHESCHFCRGMYWCVPPPCSLTWLAFCRRMPDSGVPVRPVVVSSGHHDAAGDWVAPGTLYRPTWL